MARYAYVNGRYVEHHEASVHIEDRGYQLADGVYEVVGVRDGRLIDEAPHIDRLDRSRKIEVEGVGILVGKPGIGGVRHRGVEMSPVAANSAAKRPRKLFLRVSSDTKIRRRRDICGIDRSERRADGQPAREGLAVRRGVAGPAVGRSCQISSALDRGVPLSGLLCCTSSAAHDESRYTERQHTDAMTEAANDQPSHDQPRLS